MQRAGASTERRLTSRNALVLPPGAHPAVPLPVPAHIVEDPTVRVSALDQPRGDRRAGEDRRAGGDHVPAHHRNHPAVLAHHGERLRAVEDRRDFHPPEDPAGRQRLVLHLPDLRPLLARRHNLGES